MIRVLLSLLLLLPAVAHGDNKADAKAHYQRGKAAYKVHDWDEAIAEFKSAYKLTPDVVYLFNIAQAYRLKGDCTNAADFYKTYQKEEKNKKLRDAATKFRLEMEACSKTSLPPPADPVPADPAKPADPPPPPVNPIVTTAVTPPAPSPVVTTGDNAMRTLEDPDNNRGRRRVGKIFFFSGIGLFVLGGVVYETSKCEQMGIGDLRECRFAEGDKETNEGGKLLAGVGGLAVIVGAAVYLTAPKPKSSTIAVTPMGRGVGVAWTF